MIWGTWRDPNFKFRAVDPQGVAHEYITYASSVADLTERLTRKSLVVQSITPYSFSEWKERARRATRRAISQRIKDQWSHFRPQAAAYWPWLTTTELDTIAGDQRLLRDAIVEHDGVSKAAAETAIDGWFGTLRELQPAPGQSVPKTAISFANDIWRELKWHLFDLFHGKCAYCETKVLAGYVGDVEHYRPKGKVDEDPDHPGYYWLAWDESNLLPACMFCNQYRDAKLTHFPVDGVHARDPVGLAAEQPLLLNPYNRLVNPFEHLEFSDAGVSTPRNASQFGVESRKVYYLDRPGLSEARLEAMQRVEQDWHVRIGQMVSIGQAFAQLRQRIESGEEAYAAARLWALDRLRAQLIHDLQPQPRP